MAKVLELEVKKDYRKTLEALDKQGLEKTKD